MSNHRAAAAVTAALSELVRESVKGAVPMANVANRRPGVAVGDTGKPIVNVYLYRAEPNASLRNAADPIRAGDGKLVRRPVAAWNLHYLLTCIGDEAQLEPDLLLGAVVTGLNCTAVLARGFLVSVNATLASETGNRRLAAGSALEQQVDLVRLTPIDLSLEALTQLWSSLTREPYVLSVAYQASVVLMSSDVSLAVPLPVGAAPSLALATLSAPRITSVADSQSAMSPILIGSTLVIEGERLVADHLQLRLGTLNVDLSGESVSARRIELPLTPLDAGGAPQPLALSPGVLGVQIRHLIDVSTQPGTPELRPGATSNIVPIVLRPAIIEPPALVTDAGGADAIALVIAPAPRSEWEHCLLLNEFGASAPRALVIDLWSIDADGRLLFPSLTVPAGNWLVRVQVNGAESPLVQDASGLFTAPRLAVA